MTPEQIKEAMHFASMWGVAKIHRYRVCEQGATFMSEKAAKEKEVKAEAKLRNYLEQSQTVSDAHTTPGETP